jgi:ATP-binding cassette subfamily B protein
MDQKIPKNPILFGFYITKFHKKWAISAVICAFFATALSRSTVILLGNLTDAIAATPIVMETIWLWAIAYPTVFFIGENTWRLSGFLGMRWFMNFRYSAYQHLFEYLTLHSKDYFNSRFAGSLSNKITNAVDGTQAIFERSLWNFFPLILGLIWFSIFAFASNALLGLIMSLWSILFLTINILFARHLQPRSYKSAKAVSTLKGRIVDSLSNISLVHEYAYVAGERDYIRKFIKKDRDAGLDLWRLSEWMLFVNGVLICLFMFVMIGTSIFLFQQQTVTAGVVVMVIAISLKLSDQLLFLGMEIRDATRFYGEAKEGLEEILQEHIIVNAPDALGVTFSQGAITIESIDFEYENTKVFSNFSLAIPAGQKVGFVGRSGSGKTTFVSLLLRHFDVQKGEIKVDGQNITNVTLESLRRAIAFVPQDTSLFHRTIRENIRYSSPSATDEDIVKAATQAEAHGFIMQLPEGYNTLVGERGVKLSGGQRQRIAIARAFLKNAPILVLDEATSSLDSESEHAIQLSLEELMKGRTVIAIAHRLSTLKKMDRIIIIKNGKIIEDGAPDTLLQRHDGIFKTMWEHQIKGFIAEE